MATQGEKALHALEVQTAILLERVEALSKERIPLRELSSQVAVLQQQLGDMTKTRELWGQRGWAVLTVGISAAVSLGAAILVALVNYYMNHPK